MTIFKQVTPNLRKVITFVRTTENGCVAKTYNSLLDMPENERKAYIMAAFSRIENTPTPEEVSVAREHLQNAINARLAQRGK